MRCSPLPAWRAYVRAGLVVAAAAACYLPAGILEPAAPALVGRYLRSDGTPAAGAVIALDIDGVDETCSEAQGRGATDSAGVFHVGATIVRRGWVMIIPPLERFFNHYTLCLGAADSVLHPAYSNMVRIHTPDLWAGSDTVTCQEWQWADRARVTCAGPGREEALQSGGTWADSSGSGYYRLIVADPDDRESEPFVLLQWVERIGAGGAERVRDAMVLPMAPKVVELEAARLWLVTDRPACVSARSSGRPPRILSWGPARANPAFELGPPGERRAVRSCSDEAR